MAHSFNPGDKRDPMRDPHGSLRQQPRRPERKRAVHPDPDETRMDWAAPRYAAPPESAPPPQLPDFKPKGMSRTDKVLAWVAGFIVLFFALGTVNKFTSTTSSLSHGSTPSATSTSKNSSGGLTVKLSSTEKWYIDAYASLHHVSETQATWDLLQAGIKAQK